MHRRAHHRKKEGELLHQLIGASAPLSAYQRFPLGIQIILAIAKACHNLILISPDYCITVSFAGWHVRKSLVL